VIRAAPFALLLLFGCSNSTPAGPPIDEMLQRQTRAGDLAYTLERPDEAIAQYRLALTRAKARDDTAAIGNLGYNLAVAELRAGAADRALAVIGETQQELARRGAGTFPALDLAEATALYRLNRWDQAAVALAAIGPDADAQTMAQSIFLKGMIADHRGDRAALAAAVAGLQPGDSVLLRADAAELAARLALRDGDAKRAEVQAETAAALRRDGLDYRGLARTLALAGESAAQSGDRTKAASLFLRAGRSAEAQGDSASARQWLAQAAALDQDRAVQRSNNAPPPGLEIER
jgi:hypothetical protein